MKKIFFLIVVIAASQFSFTKPVLQPSAPKVLEGKWRMISVKSISGIITTKPSFIQGDVDITFTQSTTAEGSFSGNTPTNVFQGNYSLGENKAIQVPAMSMTKVVETSWGGEFSGHIRTAQQYSFDDGRLSIKTAGNTLTFRKL